MTVALDATYSVGDGLSGVGVYSREIMAGLAGAHPEARFRFCYRAHRFLRSFQETLPANARRALLGDRHVPGADIFHGLNQRLPAKRARRAVTTFHDLFVLTGDYSTPEFRARFAAQARHAAEYSDRIVTVSSFTAAQVHDLLGVERERIHAIHHGVRALPRGGARREKTILSVGAIQRRKNTARLVEAFERLDPAWRLVLAGSAGFGAEEILARIENSPARGRIQVLGYVTSGELAAWYARASIFAFPSLDEGFGMPVLEAMAAGVPVVASNRSALPEVTGDAAWLVDAGDTGELAAALEELIRNEEARHTLTARGLDRAKLFTWEKAVRETWAVYDRLLLS